MTTSPMQIISYFLTNYINIINVLFMFGGLSVNYGETTEWIYEIWYTYRVSADLGGRAFYLTGKLAKRLAEASIRNREVYTYDFRYGDMRMIWVFFDRAGYALAES